MRCTRLVVTFQIFIVLNGIMWSQQMFDLFSAPFLQIPLQLNMETMAQVEGLKVRTSIENDLADPYLSRYPQKVGDGASCACVVQ